MIPIGVPVQDSWIVLFFPPVGVHLEHRASPGPLFAGRVFSLFQAEDAWWCAARGAVLRFYEAFMEVRLGAGLKL